MKECCNHNCNQGRDCPLRKRNLSEEITEGFKSLEVMRNNEPVAWVAYDEFGDFMLETTPEGDYPWQPLYTHPAKTLTDEEIQEVIDDPQFETIFELEDFAKAILRKASEK
jgi:hypothetical protein